MDKTIRGDVARSIGGDRQRIHKLDTEHSATTFKHVLLPIWSAAFQFREETFRFVVNGRTGKIRGERPYSRFKIALAVVASLALVGGFIYFANASGAFSSDPYGDYRNRRSDEFSIENPYWPNEQSRQQRDDWSRGSQRLPRFDDRSILFPPKPAF